MEPSVVVCICIMMDITSYGSVIISLCAIKLEIVHIKKNLDNTEVLTLTKWVFYDGFFLCFNKHIKTGTVLVWLSC